MPLPRLPNRPPEPSRPRQRDGTAPPLILAHRGLRLEKPENTISAFEAARRAGCDGVEFDVRRLADGAWVLHHDARLRVGRRRYDLDRVRRADLRKLRLRGGVLPTLEHVLRWSARHPSLLFDIELKPGAYREEILPLLDARRRHPTVVTTFDLDTARRLKATRPRLRVGAVSVRPDAKWADGLRRADLDVAVIPARRARNALLGQLSNRGLEPWVWGIRRPSHAAALSDLGVAAFITDVPRALLPSRPT